MIEKLDDAGLTLDPADDIRGDVVVDRDGARLGNVSALFVDVAERKVRAMELRAGGFLGVGDRHFLLPIEAVVRTAAGEVRVNHAREHVLGAPAYDPVVFEAHPHETLQETYDHYGVAPSWSTGKTPTERPQQF